jgi:hypothetical protein
VRFRLGNTLPLLLSKNAHSLLRSTGPVFSEVTDTRILTGANSSLAEAWPKMFVMEPVYSAFGKAYTDIAGALLSVVSWEMYLVDLVPNGIEGIQFVLSNSCGQSFTFEVNGHEVRREMIAKETASHLKRRLTLSRCPG